MIKCNNECPLGKFDGCCHSCPDIEICKDACESNPDTCGEVTFDEETGLVAFKEQQLSVLKQEEQEAELKAKLKEAMEKYGIKKFDSDILKITYIAETTATSIDSAKLKKKYPAIAEECSKTSEKSAYIKVEIKDET